MSDTMLLGVLRMPFDLAMSTPTAQIQYYHRGVQAADEIEKLRAELDRTHALLKDPNAVAVNMLRGVIALPSADQISISISRRWRASHELS